jgi:ABC-type oligopeptide transport system substrate-binding subunit
VSSLSLGPLSNEAVGELLRELTAWTGDDPSFGALIFRETRGNPLFVVETVASLREEERLPESAESWQRDFLAKTLTIPSGVQKIIETRLSRLDDLSRQLITAAAVMRGSFKAQVLQMISGRNEFETLEGLEHLLTSGLLVEAGEDRFTFSHDKIREVAYGGLSQLRRRLLHRRVAESLEQQYRGREEAVPERLAYHYERAGVADKALDNYLQAGHMARLRYAHESAISHYQKALAYLRAQGDYGRAARTLMQLGLTYHTAFDFEQARRAYDEGLALWQQAGETQPSVLPPAAPQTLRLGWVEPSTLDPAAAFHIASLGVIEQLFSGLLALTPELEVVPDIARNWEMSEGGRKYIFHLRKDVRWSDEAPVTAGDFEFAWKRALDPTTGSIFAGDLYAVKGARDFHQGKGSSSQHVGVRAVNAVTLVVELEEPTGYFLQLLTLHRTYPVPRHVVELHGQAWTEAGKIVTCGPFKLEAWNPGESIHLLRNPDYHGQFGGNLERVELVFQRGGTSAAVEMLEMYQADGLDVFDLQYLPMPDRDHARQRHVEEYITGPRLHTWHAGFNVSKPPFGDCRVRQAFTLATDRETLGNVVLRGYQFPATGGYVPPGMPGHSAGIGLPYDPERARWLLAQAGWPGGRGFPTVKALQTPRADARCEYLQAQWEEALGVAVRFETLEFMAFRHRLDHEPPHVYVLNWVADFPDPDNVLRANTFRRSTRWRNESYERLLEEARRVMDQEDRMNLYRQADQILVEEAPLIPLTYDRMHLLVKPWVSKYPTSGIRWWFWKDVIMEPH